MKFSSPIVAFSFSFLMLFSSMRMSLTFAYYKLDPVGFIERLCENKDKPKLECNGKCQLSKLAQSTSNDTTNNTPYTVDLKEVLLFNESPDQYRAIRFFEHNDQVHFYQNLYSYILTKSSFHPPQC